MAATAWLITEGVGTGIAAAGQVSAGRKAKTGADLDAFTIGTTADLNARLIEHGADLNAGVHDFNAAALDAQAKDAVTRGKESEDLFRKQLRGFIGSQRASYAAQGVDVSDGSPLDVQMDTAKQGEQDALTIRMNAAREAWGFKTAAAGERLQSANTRRLGLLQAENTREVGRFTALNARLGGSYRQSSANWGAASTLLTGTGNMLARKYGF